MFHHFLQKFSTKIYDPPRSLGFGEKKKRPKHTMVLQWGQSSPWTNDPQVMSVWLGWHSPTFFLGREKYDGGGLFWESRAPLLSLLGCQKPRIWRTIVNCGLVSAGEADFKAPKLARDSHENGICPMEKKHRKSSISQILHLWDPTSLEKAASKPSLGKFPLMWLAGDFKTVHLKIRCISEEDHYEPPL